MNILGINAYHADSSAAIVKDGILVAALEEERLRREKHWAGLPTGAIQYCLDAARLTLSQIDYIVLSKNPFAHLAQKLYQAIRMSPANTRQRINANIGLLSIKDYLARDLGFKDRIKARIIFVEHHKAHLACALYTAPFKDGLILSCDGTGDMRTTMWALAKEGRINIKGGISFPHSLGFLYTAVTQFLGFSDYGDEYKVMGLAPYGRPNYKDQLYRIIKVKNDGTFSLDLSYFNINQESASMGWLNCKPHITRLYSDKFIHHFDKPRLALESINNRHKDIACSLQVVLEEVILNLLKKLNVKFKQKNLFLSGGVFANSVICGKLSQLRVFSRIYVPPAPADAGTAIGAAAYFYYQKNKQLIKNMHSAFLGPEYTQEEIKKAIDERALKYKELSDDQMLDSVVGALINKKIVGWFQGRMEFGYRALGARSILAHPGLEQIRDILNKRIKNRESFRPFAPSIIEEQTPGFFCGNGPSPYMSFVAKARLDRADKIKAVVHIDNTARVHTVNKQDNPLFYRLLERFSQRTGLPLLLNTSFNENEPIVNSPLEAIDCFLRTKMDALAMGNVVIEK
jgi:carbamoyltransferase